MPIVMGMVAGVFLRFGLDLVFAHPRRILDRRADGGRVRRDQRVAALQRLVPPLSARSPSGSSR